MANKDQPQSKDTQAEKIHRETGAAWEIIAKAGYMGEVEKDVEFIQNGGVSLMKTECRLLEGLNKWCDCAIQLQCSGGKDLLSIWNLGAKKVIGIDISQTLITYAKQKSDALKAPASWHCCDVLETPNELDGCDEYPDLFWNQFENVPKETAGRLPHTYSVLMKKGNTHGQAR